jgi:small GTP-binding protein
MKSDPDHSYKVILLGNSGTGKTSILHFAMTGCQDLDVRPTIGCQASVLTVGPSTHPITLKLWDTAGQELFSSIVPIYIRGATAALLVYDVTDYKSFSSLDHWYSVLMEEQNSNVHVYIVCNKIDLIGNSVVLDSDGRGAAVRLNGHFYEVSAFTGAGISDMFSQIGHDIADATEPRVMTNRPLLVPATDYSESTACC